MGCRNESPTLVNDALLITTMCLIGISVEVYIKDGSLYSGIFHTACVDDLYAIVLKRAKMIKKGSCDSNVANEDIIETLIIQSKDLVQVIAKRVLLPADGFVGHETGDNTGAVASSISSNGTPFTEANKTSSKKSNVGQPHTSQTRSSPGTENGLANGFKPEVVVHSTNSVEAQPPKPTKIHVNPSTPNETVVSKTSNSNQASKEFKLNPGAKIFCPSIPNKRAPTPPAMATGGYIPDTFQTVTVAAATHRQPEVEISPFVSRSVPVKFVPYGGNDVLLQHPPPPIVGYMTNRNQPVRYTGQYHHPIQTAPAYVHPSPQNVMVGRLGPVVYVHPVSQDMVPSTTGFPQMSKHQGYAVGQALPPFIAASGGGLQPPFVLPTHIPISHSQPPYPMPIPGSNGFLVSKFS